MRVKERENFKDGNQNENLSSNILFSREMFYFLFFYINFLLIFHCSSLKKKKKKKNYCSSSTNILQELKYINSKIIPIMLEINQKN